MAQWSIPFRQATGRMREDVEGTVRRAIIKLFYKVVLPSPVDTGRFRANWNVAYGAPNPSTDGKSGRTRRHSGTGTQVGRTRTASTASSRERAQIESVNRMPATGVIYLTNNLAYAVKLEYGHSAQAPSGMVRIAVAQWPEILRRSRRG